MRPHHHSLVVRLAAPLAGAAVLALGAASPASAAGENHDDAVRDQVSQGEPAPQRYADITEIATRHSREAVVVTTRFRRVGPSYLYFAARIRTPEAQYEVVYDAYLADAAEFELRDEFDMTRACAGLRGRVDEDADLVRVSVPRSCLGRPEVVRTGALTGTPRRSSPDGRLVPQPAVDDARLRGRLAGSGDEEQRPQIKLGPPVRVG